MKLLMIPFEDHFNNLLTLFLILITLSATESNLLNDYTFDGATCAHVELNLVNSQKQGYIHSPFYYTSASSPNSTEQKCNWILNSPSSSHKIDLTLIDLVHTTPSNTNCLVIKSLDENPESANQTHFWINLVDYNIESTTNNETKRRRRLIEFTNEINTCSFNLKPFTKIETNLSRILIEYDYSSSSSKFLIMFNTRDDETYEEDISQICNNPNEDLKCSTKYDVTSNAYHYSCIPRNLICSCDLFVSNHTKCSHLLNEDLHLDLDESNCYYFLKLNNMCQNEKLLSRIVVPNEEDDDQTVEIGHFKQKSPAQFECVNQTLTNEYGWLSSPGFGSSRKSYPSGLTCFYHVAFQHNQIVQIRFKYFTLASSIVDLTLNNNNETELAKQRKRSIHDLDEASSSFRKRSNTQESRRILPVHLGRTLDYDHVTLFDGMTTQSPVLAHFNGIHNDFNRYFNGKTFNSRSNHLLIMFHTTARTSQLNRYAKFQLKSEDTQQQLGFNLTYQIKGLCIEDQLACNSLYELNCYSRNQTCNDVWDCHNGADERGCGRCRPDQFRCRNDIFCYRLEDRCDGDHQCVDKSDELNCDAWFCNSDNGTFLCNNGRCIYEQWVCDGTNDCDDGSDEINCPTPFTRRVITTAVLGGTLCCLLLVMALGCACKLYSLHTVGYRNNIRLSSAAAAAAAAASVPLISSNHSPARSVPQSEPVSTTTPPNTNNNNNSLFYSNLATLFRRALTTTTETANNNNNGNTVQTTSISLDPSSTSTTSTTGCLTGGVGDATSNTHPTGDLPQPHHLIAPPTYNQTMGLVDEYEQRQLAFIEHVRSILLAQQQQQQQQNSSNQSTAPLINLTNSTQIPTATSSSTVLHRVTSGSSSSGGRRSHSSRHHRHHHHHRSSSINTNSNNLTNSTDSSAQVSNAELMRISSSHSRRHHHHRHRTHHHIASNHHHHSHNHNQCLNLNNLSGQLASNLSQVNFDSNRRGLVMMNQEASSNSSSSASRVLSEQRRRSSGLSPASDLLQMTRTNTSANNDSPTTSSAASNTTPSLIAAATTTTTPGTSNVSATNTSFSTLVNKSQTNSINLRDRIAKLIKDIVVHHGDNIQYVQLSDQTNNNNNNNITTTTTNTNATNTPTTIQSNTTTSSSSSTTVSSTTNTSQLANSSNLSQNGSEEDSPLIQP